MRTVPSSGIRGRARRAGFVVLAALCVTGMLATAASAQSVAAKKPKPKGPSAGSLAGSLGKGAKSTFSATYNIKFGTVVGTYTFAQKPPDYMVTYSTKEGMFEFLEIGKLAYGCTTTASLHICVKETVSVAAPYLDLIEPSSVAPEVSAFASGAKGVSISTATYAKQSSTCASGKYNGVKTTYCVTGKGLLAYAGTKAGSISLAGFSASPPSSDFTLPAGAKIEG